MSNSVRDGDGVGAAGPSWRGRLVGGLALLGLYRLLVGPASLAEWLAGATSAIAASVSMVAVAEGQPAERLGRGCLGLLRRLPGRVIGDCVRVGMALLARRAPAGEFRSVPFDFGGDDPGSIGRRALVIAAESLPPNGYVVTADREGGRLLVHQLVPVAGPARGQDRLWPL